MLKFSSSFSSEPHHVFTWRGNGSCFSLYFEYFLVKVICFQSWTGCALPYLASEETPLVSGPLTNDEISWIGSIDW